MFWNGSTAIDGLFGSGSGSAGSAAGASVGASSARASSDDGTTAGAASGSTSATKRNPRLWSVRMTFCALPSSPTARRAALMREFSAASDTTRPCHTVSNSSSLLMIRSRCCTR